MHTAGRMSAPPLQIERLSPWIELRFSRSPGPGGQNVNKVNTRVTVLFDFESCNSLNTPQRKRIRDRLATRLARDGRLRVVCHRERTQARNRSTAETRLVELLTEALRRPKTRVATRPTAASRERRVRSKKQRGDLKRLRQTKPTVDD